MAKVSNYKIHVEKYGKEEADRRREECIRKNKFSNSLAGYIAKYGEELGRQKYEEKNKRVSVGIDSLRARGFSDDEIRDIKERHRQNSKITLENLCKKYGEELGKQKYDVYIRKSKEKSIWSVEHYIKLGYSEEEAKNIISDIQRKDLKYFILRYGELEGTEKYKDYNRKKSTSLEMYIEKHGEVEGQRKFQEKKNIKSSRTEIQLFDKVSSYFNEEEQKWFCYGKNQYKIGLRKEIWERSCGAKLYLLDFFDRRQNKIIEFNGDLWHANPEIFKENDTPNPYERKKTSKEIWEKDQARYAILAEMNYSVLVIWEKDYLRDMEKTIQKCVDFLKGEKNESF